MIEDEKSPENSDKTPEEKQFEADKKAGFYQTPANPDLPDETIRKSGLAYGAGIALAGSVIFMLIIGWILDSFLGTAPWCLVGGIVLGSVIGFYQFFRITSQILKK